MLIREEQLNSAINNFIMGIDKGPFKNLKNTDCNEFKSGNVIKALKDKDMGKDIFRCAVDQAWLDMCRTTTGDSGEKIRKCFGDEIREIYKKEKANSLECLIYPAEIGLTVGQRQKIINMANKYLYCCEDIRNNEKYSSIFKKAHMPLDAYILEWYERIVVNWFINEDKEFLDGEKRFIKGKMREWSKIQGKNNEDTYEEDEKIYYSYDFYQRTIKEYIENNIEPKNKYSPLEIEFLIWPEIRLLLATESLIFSTDIYSPSEKKELRIKHNIKENAQTINNLVNEMPQNTIWF